jgi:phosphoribosylformylglycinamidine synthase
LGTSRGDINSSEYLHKVQGVEFSPVPHFDLEEEFVLQQKIAELIEYKLVESAHDVSEGGLFVALIESCFNRNLGIDVVASDYKIRKDAYWFGEAQSRVVVSVKNTKLTAFKKTMEGTAYEELGEVTTGAVEVDGMNWGTIYSWKEKYDNAITSLLAGHESEHALSTL